ncbi:unnamed protein product [Psylliodes chrysocephalus]|uniref:Uncharacterized protein n=1 Tax=Psylliodes chrysocephalus TaxID=3402493 RepID=A0A9P0CLH6_9CUCU|nr:unnamed protein product [Psylliodes chrysocephala]
MSYEEKQTQCTEIDKREFTLQVFQCVTYIIHKSPVLQELFLKWSALSSREKFLLNYIAFYIIDSAQSDLYAPIIQGFHYWNNIQDTEGACGFDGNPLEFKFGLDEEKRIFQIIVDIDHVISNILLRPILCKEIQKSCSKNVHPLMETGIKG